MIRLRFFLTFLLLLQLPVLQASGSRDLRLLLNKDEREKLFSINPGIIDRGKYEFEMMKPDLMFGFKTASGIFLGSILANMKYKKTPITIPAEGNSFLDPNEEDLVVYHNENDQNESTINIEEEEGLRKITLADQIPLFIEEDGKKFFSPIIQNENIIFSNNLRKKIGNFFLKKNTILFITKNDEEYNVYCNPNKEKDKAPNDFNNNKKISTKN
jgi:hypothetical protein